MALITYHSNIVLKKMDGSSINDGDSPKGKIMNIHLDSIIAGHIRGNHYYEFETEFKIIFGGSVRIVTKDTTSGDTNRINSANCEMPHWLIAKPKIAHAI